MPEFLCRGRQPAHRREQPTGKQRDKQNSPHSRAETR